jgi:hypothetical protein
MSLISVSAIGLSESPVSAAPLSPCNGLSTFGFSINGFLWSANRPTLTDSDQNITCIVAPSSTNIWVNFTVQRTLNACYNQTLAIDGVIGPATVESIRGAQRYEILFENANITVDGLIGPGTSNVFNWLGTRADLNTGVCLDTS